MEEGALDTTPYSYVDESREDVDVRVAAARGSAVPYSYTEECGGVVVDTLGVVPYSYVLEAVPVSFPSPSRERACLWEGVRREWKG